MISFDNHLGTIKLSQQYLVDLITHTVTNCFGVAGVSSRNNRQAFLSYFTGADPKRSIKLKYNKKFLEIDLHILMAYGVNISETVRSIKHKIRYNIEDLTELEIGRINIFVDGIKE